MSRYFLIAVLSIISLSFFSLQADAQQIRKVSFLGSSCSNFTAKADGVESVHSLKVRFSDFAIAVPPELQPNVAHCKVHLAVQNNPGFALRFTSLRIMLGSQGDRVLEGDIYLSFFDGSVFRASHPIKLSISSKNTPKEILVSKVGAGAQNRFCSGEVVPYQILLVFAPKPSSIENEIGGSSARLSIEGIKDLVVEERECV